MNFSSGTVGMEVLMPGTANRLANATLAIDGIFWAAGEPMERDIKMVHVLRSSLVENRVSLSDC